MRALLLRDLRRLAPYGLAAAPLALALPPVDVTGLLVHVALAAVLGVAAVAPDTAAGGTAFLLRLPARPVGVAATKLLAAALWLLPALAAALARDARDLGVGLPCLSAAGFGAGALASVVAHRVMPAVLLAPLLLVTFGLLSLLPFAVLGAQPQGFLAQFAGPTGLGVASVGLALLAFARGERHRSTPRPAVIAAGGLATLGVLTFTSTAGAYAWTLEREAPRALAALGAAPLGEGGLVVELEADLWCGVERRVVTLGPEGVWQVPLRQVAWPQASPDGRFVLLTDFRLGGGWLLDVAARTTTRLPRYEPHRDVAWGPDGAVTLLRSHQGLEPVDLLRLTPANREDARAVLHVPGAHYVGLAEDGRALLVDDAGVVAGPLPGSVTPAPEVERLVAWPADLVCVAAMPAPGGRLLVLDPAGELHALDLGSGARVGLGSWEGDALYLHASAVRFAPGGRHAALRLAGSRTVVVDLATGARVVDALPPSRSGPWSGHGPVWTPDGQALALPWGPVVTVDGGERAAVPGGAVGFVAGRAVARGAALADVLGGAR